QASRMAAFLGKKYDIGPEGGGAINRADWNQIKDRLQRQRPGLRTLEFPSNVRMGVSMRGDRAPFNAARGRRAGSMALDRTDLIDAVSDGVGVLNPPGIPAALREWALPVDQF